MTSDNSLREGRTGVKPIDFFDRKVPLTSENGVEKKKIQTSLEVTKGQNEVKGQPEAARLVDHSSATPNPNLHFVLELLQKE